jgi:hypothetical protein
MLREEIRDEWRMVKRGALRYHAQVDVSDLRRRILRALDEARRDVSGRQRARDEAALAWDRFLSSVAVPLVRQAAGVLRAEGHAFSVHAPAGGVRLASDASPESFLEFELDASGTTPQVIGRVSVTHGRQGHVIVERPLAPDKRIADLADDDVAAFLVAEIPKLVVRP